MALFRSALERAYRDDGRRTPPRKRHLKKLGYEHGTLEKEDLTLVVEEGAELSSVVVFRNVRHAMMVTYLGRANST